MRINNIELLFGDFQESNIDYKVSLNEIDEENHREDFLFYKISPKNLSKEECEKDLTLVYCTLDQDTKKIILSPELGNEGEEIIDDKKYEIIIDSYPILDSNTILELRDINAHLQNKVFLFPMQIANGNIKKISISSAQMSGTLNYGYIGIYANDKPTVIGSKLVFDTISANASFDDAGNCIFSDDNMPEIKGSWVDDNGVEHYNIFYYVIFYMIQKDAGYNILSRITDNLKNVSQLPTKTFGCVTNFDNTFHDIFDYDVDSSDEIFDYSEESLKHNKDKIFFLPYMNITMIV